MAQQGVRDPELEDPEIRKELDRKVREERETVIKGGFGGKTLDSQERLAEGRKKGGLSRKDESGKERAEREPEAVRIEVDKSKLEGIEGIGGDGGQAGGRDGSGGDGGMDGGDGVQGGGRDGGRDGGGDGGMSGGRDGGGDGGQDGGRGRRGYGGRA